MLFRLFFGLVFLSCCSLVASSCTRGGDSRETKAASQALPDSKDLNVVVLLLDTLRADHLPFYGYTKNTAPFLSTLIDRSVVFERAMATASCTAPSTASIFTSYYPSQHGVVTGFLATQRLQRVHPALELNKLPGDLTTMAEMFKDAGYRTYLLSDNVNISEQMGFAQGFERSHTFNYKGAEVMNDKLREWSKDIRSNGKYFMWVQYMDPHRPYHQRSPWFQKQKSRKANTIAAYDSEINYLDDKIKEMFELFGWKENTMVIVLSDHGEEFWEHGQLGHGRTLYRESIHVPFVIYHPFLNNGKRVSTMVRSMDLLPTLAELLKFPADSGWEGESLLPLIDGQEAPRQTMLSQMLRKQERTKRSVVRSIIMDEQHYIHTTTPDGEASEELYNLRLDWEEQQDLAKEKVDQVGELSQQLTKVEQALKQFDEEVIEIEIDEAGYEQLRTLGYVD